MSHRTKSAMKLKSSHNSKKSTSTRCSFTSVRPSSKLSKNQLSKDFKSCLMREKNSNRNPSIKNNRSNVSPYRKNCLENSFHPSEESFRTLEKSFVDESSEENTVESLILKRHRKNSSDSINFSQELNMCQKKNKELQARINKLQRMSCNSAVKFKMFQESNQKTSELKENIPKVQKSTLKKEKNTNNEKGVKKMFIEKFKKAEKELNSMWRLEMQEVEQQHELRIKNKIADISEKFKRKLQIATDERLWLRKENEKLKQKLEDLGLKLQVCEKNERDEGSNEQNRKYNEILKQYLRLQNDYIQIKKDGNGLCQKCKAFMDTNFEICGKINRIREYVDSCNN